MASSPIKRLFHWGPILVLVLIKFITWAMVHLIGMWWPPQGSIGGAIHAAVFIMLSGLTLYYFLQSLIEGPGYVPLNWKPDEESHKDYLQYCIVCKGYKAPRSHHCSKCGNCVLKMDHHCPWINCCVGHMNHRYFVYFLASAVLGCLQASVVLSICMYHGLNRVWYIHNGTGSEPIIYMTLTTVLLTLLAIGMSLGVVLAVGALMHLQVPMSYVFGNIAAGSYSVNCVFQTAPWLLTNHPGGDDETLVCCEWFFGETKQQIRGILRNRTTIEDWIVEKAVSRRQELGLPQFVFPYDLGWRQNVRFILQGQGLTDGLRWPLRQGCGPYDLTREQQAQKVDKLRRSVAFVTVREYSGAWVPLLSYWREVVSAPCSDEPRLALMPGDAVRATRFRKSWLFGEKTMKDQARGPRGWFPRRAVVLAEEITADKLKRH